MREAREKIGEPTETNAVAVRRRWFGFSGFAAIVAILHWTYHHELNIWTPISLQKSDANLRMQKINLFEALN